MRDARAVKREKAKEEERKKAAAREARGEKLDDELATQGIAGALARQNSSLSKSKLQKVSEAASGHLGSSRVISGHLGSSRVIAPLVE